MTDEIGNSTSVAMNAACRMLDQCLDVIGHCVDQLSEEQIWRRPQDGMNSVGNLLLHLRGNLTQWIVAGLAGEEDTRNRPAEFAATSGPSKAELLEGLRQTVNEAKQRLRQCSSGDLLEERTIQGFHLNGWEAIFDSLPHFKGHTQEIVCLTRQQRGGEYRFHWVPQTEAEGRPPNQNQ